MIIWMWEFHLLPKAEAITGWELALLVVICDCPGTVSLLAYGVFPLVSVPD